MIGAVRLFCCGILFSILAAPSQASADEPADKAKQLRIIAFGAHPDDVEFRLAGCALKWVNQGHAVKFVSLTNGDIGHWQTAGGPLAKRRTAEVQEVAKRLGVEAEVLDIHDGELMPTLENRKTVARLIRQWQADIVIAHRPYDYHPDHRNVGLIVQDAAFMIRVPFYVPDTPTVEKNTVFLYFADRFQKPYPFQADIAVSIDEVFDKKVDAVDALASQVYEGGALGSEKVLKERQAANPIARKELLHDKFSLRDSKNADKYRAALISWYGAERGKAIKHAEVFEICEYGHQPSREEIKELFPFFGKAAD